MGHTHAWLPGQAQPDACRIRTLVARTQASCQAGDQGIRFLLVSGKPIEEPVAWYGPIVMNTQEQLRQAMAELHTGTFIKHR